EVKHGQPDLFQDAPIPEGGPIDGLTFVASLGISHPSRPEGSGNASGFEGWFRFAPRERDDRASARQWAGTGLSPRISPTLQAWVTKTGRRCCAGSKHR